MSDTSANNSPAALANSPQTCRNCGQPTTANYCSSCGQSTQLELNLRTLFLGNAPRTHWTQNPWVRTILQLFVRPGIVAREFCDGKRVKYVHPLKYCLLMSALGLVLLNVSQRRADLMPQDTGDLPPEMLRATQWVADIMIDQMGIATVAMLPLLAIFLRMFFKRHQLSFSQTMVLCLYVYGHSFFLQDIPIALGAMTSNIAATIVNLIPFVVLGIAAAQLYPEPAWKAVLKATLAHALFYLAVVILVGIFAGAAAVILHLLGR